MPSELANVSLIGTITSSGKGCVIIMSDMKAENTRHIGIKRSYRADFVPLIICIQLKGRQELASGEIRDFNQPGHLTLVITGTHNLYSRQKLRL